ncbi:MAG: LysR family transcriptional regulator [Myxococcota bacterium]
MPSRNATDATSIHAALAKLDLNLLVTLDALLEARNVTETAERFGVTQSAMSHRLARLRDYFGDSLLVATGDELVLTQRAESLQGPLRDALGGLRDALFEEAPFVPAEAERTFVVAGADLAELSMLPSLIVQLAEMAPGVRIRMAGRSELRGDALIRGRVDLAIAPGAGTVPGVTIEDTAGVRQRKLLTEGFSVLARRDHPRVRSTLSLKRYLEEGHILVAPHGQPGSVVDGRLSQDGKGRRVVCQVAHFLTAPFLVAQTDHLLTCPTSLAEAVRDQLGLRVFKPPISLPNTTIFLYWHERVHQDRGHQWLRELILAGTKHLR